jgi:hypothetical protein
MDKVATLILLTESLITAGTWASAQGQPSFAQVAVSTKVRTIEGRLRGRQDRSPNAATRTASPAVHRLHCGRKDSTPASQGFRF